MMFQTFFTIFFETVNIVFFKTFCDFSPHVGQKKGFECQNRSKVIDSLEEIKT